MLSRVRLLFVAIFLFLSFTVSSSLRCYSTICEDPDEHGFCIQTCRRPNDACYGNFFISPNHTVTPGTFLCHSVTEGECEATSCQITSTSPSFGSCCCRGQDLCNIVPGLFGDNTPAPPIIIPAPSVTPPPVAGDQLVCEYNNCTSLTSNSNCFHGYQVCTDHASADTISSSRSDHFCSVRARRTPSGHFELESKGCVITTDATVHQEGEGQTRCILDTRSSNNDIACFCDHPFCNNGSNLEFTDPSRYVGPHGDILCDARCSHSCVISNSVPRCLCPAGYALDSDLRTCVDINECADPHSHLCSHICINTEGSYRCDCPPNQGLRLAINGTHCEQIPGLFCARHDQDCDSINGCDDISFCDRSLNLSREYIHDPAHESCIAIVDFNNGEFVVSFQSCFVNSGTCGEDECKLERTRNRENVYSCCCRSNLCNTRLIYPDIVNDTGVPPDDTTTVTTDETTDPEETVANTIGRGTSMEGLSRWTLPVFAAVASVVLILSVVLVIICVIVGGQKKCFSKAEDELEDYSQPIELPPATTQLLPRATQFENPPIGSGRFSTVYKQMVGRDVRAVKVFQCKDKQSYDRELSIYRQPNFKHPNILLFIGSNEYPEELQLIFEYHEVGSLYDLLNKQTISMRQFCNIASSAAKGLAHLHTEVIKDGALIKACIAHRDLKSKNILIKSDLQTACISDFGLAIKWPIETATEAQGQVGTSRYMAPEVLEGAISFDREAYFRIDIYAFALILWELTTRTKTPNGPVAEYRPPFDDLVPSNPSIDDMKRVVVDWQRRPEIPKAFSNHSEMDSIVNTIQETWDGDIDARLSSQCVYERLATFASNHESTKDSGFSPSEFDSAEPHGYSTPSHGSSIMSGSPTNTMKPAISEASTTLTGGAIPMTFGYPNAAVHSGNHHNLHQSHVHTEQLEAMMSSLTSNNNQRQAAVGGVGGGGPRPPPTGPGGGNPMVNYPQLPAVNVAPPLHSPGEYQYRFVQAPSFPNNNQQQSQGRHGNQSQQSRHGNQSQLPVVTVYNSRPPGVSSMPSTTSSQRSNIPAATAATEQFTNLNHRNSREISRQQAPATPTSVQYHLESTV